MFSERARRSHQRSNMKIENPDFSQHHAFTDGLLLFVLQYVRHVLTSARYMVVVYIGVVISMFMC